MPPKFLLRVILPALAVIAVGVGGWAWFRISKNAATTPGAPDFSAASAGGITVTPAPIAPSPNTADAIRAFASADVALIPPTNAVNPNAPTVSFDEEGNRFETPSDATETDTAPPIPSTVPIPDRPPATSPVIPRADGGEDPDEDGLTNDQEAAQRTDALLADTDGDGLLDGEEVRTYRSDPLNPDTDGDSYQDGVEVGGGYNPNGAGTL
ncbi:MAG: Cellulosome-anchoring protein precursor [Candidatus Parcubacteria bacterium]|jgi:hypothetical protein